MIDQARARIEGWKSSLLELDAPDGNPLLDLRDGPSCLPLPGVDPRTFVAALADGDEFAFEAGCDPAVDNGWLRIPLPTRELEQRLTQMRRAARAELGDAGESTLWVALGLLTWIDRDAVTRVAPLALAPVELDRAAGGAMRLVAAAGVQPRVNAILVEKLRSEFDLVLDTELGELDLVALFDAAAGIVVTRPGWAVAVEARLALCSLRTFSLWRDLDTFGDDELLATGLVAHLAADHGPFAQPSIAAAEAVTRPRGSAELLAPLDADASQLAAIAAAAAGASFVLAGPPGTGKSQTIANLIAHGISHGKTVLFVSPRRAALEVVHQRLAAVGLGEFCLELHAEKATHQPVLAQLGRVLERAFRPGAGPSGDDARLAELTAALDAHVAAMHKVGPFGRSLDEVLGRLVELRTTPCAALADRDAVGLDRATFDLRRMAVDRLATAALPVEPVATHPWRRSTLTPAGFGPTEEGRARALAALDEVSASLGVLETAVREVGGLVPGLGARSRTQLEALGALATVAASSPRPGAELLTQIKGGRGDDLGEKIALIRARGAGSVEAPRDPLAFLALATRHRQLAAEVEAAFTPAIAELDAAPLWTQLRKWSHRVGPLRYVALRAARGAVTRAAVPGALESDAAMVTALEAVIAERACRDALVAAAEPARRWFGELGGDPLTLALDKVEAAVAWSAELRKAFDAVDVSDSGRPSAWRSLVAQVAAGPGGAAHVEASAFARLGEAAARWQPALASLATTLGIDERELTEGDDHIPTMRERVDGLRLAIDAMHDWVLFHAARHAAQAAGIGPAVTAIERGDLGADELAPAWERATLLMWADAELGETPALDRFHGAAHHAQVSAFADLDRGALALARARALVRLAERVPKPSTEPAVEGGELELLVGALRQATRAGDATRSQRSLRSLFATLPTVLPRLAPCVIASPLAVAELLDPSLPRFDVVVIDEATEMPLAEAIGVLARGHASVICGDPAREPPTGASVLGACLAARLPKLELTWHYRSKHEDLITYANERYYGGRLQVFPTAQGAPDLGVTWRRIDGVFDREGAGDNRAEAEAVVADALARLRDPIQRARSIAIVACSTAQRALIEDLLDEARAADPTLDATIDPPRNVTATFEPLIVRDLSSCHGHERDVVLLSIGFGPEADGLLSMAFGVLAQPGGERQLASAATAAREQLVVFSSFAPEDLHDDAAVGVRDLAALIAFAAAGGGAARADEAPPASPITDAIARALIERGWSVRHQVGCGSFKIDLAVVDPNDADRYVLGIELDGSAYASAPAARDRDRLRPQVLAELGWRLHRIWGLDWWADPEREIQRAHGAIVTAIAASRQRRAPIAPSRPRPRRSSLASGSTPVNRLTTPATGNEIALAAGTGPTEATPLAAYEGTTTPTRISRGMISIGPYTAAAIPAGRRTPDDLFAARHVAELGKVVEQVLAAEAPMHVELLARRVGGYFGIGRLTQRVTDQVRVALEGRGRFGDEADVVWRLDQDPALVPAVRVAGHGAGGRREIIQVPLSELASAARIVVERAGGISTNELVRDSARLLGFARITDQVVARVTMGVQLAVARELIRIADGKASVPAS